MHKLLLLLLAGTATATADDAIRSLPIRTIENLGKELYRRDQMAANAFDALFAAHPEARELPIKGWITQADKDHQRVYFIQERESQYSLAFTATFQKRDEPQIEDQRGAALPRMVEERFAARRAAIAAVSKFMTQSYNVEVLDAPDGKGFLVYALAATKDPNEVIVGGHYRISVAHGGEVQQVDALSRSFLVLERRSDAVALTMSHFVSDTPVETHVFVSLLHKIPLYVATSKRSIWRVNGGEITKMDDKK